MIAASLDAGHTLGGCPRRSSDGQENGGRQPRELRRGRFAKPSQAKRGRNHDPSNRGRTRTMQMNQRDCQSRRILLQGLTAAAGAAFW